MPVVAPAVYPSMPSSPLTGGLTGFSNHFEYYYYTSAPTSPSQRSCSSLSSPWEEQEEFDFTFGVGQQLKNKGPPPALADADELFEGGRIRPLNHPSRRQSSYSFSSAPSQPTVEGRGRDGEGRPKKGAAKERGRTLSSLLAAPSRSRGGTRSLSPMRGGGGSEDQDLCKSPIPSPTTATTSLARSHGRKWSLKDLFLFRSASEGRAAGGRSKDPLLSSSSSPQNLKNDGNGLSKRRGAPAPAASLHQAHYTANRAAAEELKKRTPLPFHRHSLFGYLRSSAAAHGISRRFGGYSNRRAA